jgi:HK97 family phage major capsid protein
LIYQVALEDAFIDLKGYVMSEITRQFNEVEGVAFLSGDGSNKPKGILDGHTAGSSAALNNANATYQVIDSGVDGALGADASATFNFLRAVVRSVKTPYLANCRWMMNRATHETLLALQNGDNEYYMNRDVTTGGAARLFGYEITINEDMASAPTTTGADFPILFGDFAQSFQIIDRVGVSMLEDPYTTKGATSYYTRKRVGSMIKNVETLKLVSIAKS